MSKYSIDNIISLCKRRGFVYPGSDIYGGLAASWDYGHLGIELKNNIRDKWYHRMTRDHEEITGIDSSIILHPNVWKASGHVSNFTDPLVDCKNCKTRYRADQIDTTKPCPHCGKHDFTEERDFNLMFKTNLGVLEDEKNKVYLRPETAQGIYINFKNFLNTSRVKLPFGVAQVGKSFRNEVVAKNFIFRTYEFEQMEMQYFINPKDEEDIFEYWKKERMDFYTNILGINPEKLRFFEHPKNKLAHYARKAFDIEYEFPFGFQEIEGIHNRGAYDLTQHSEASGKDMSYDDDGNKFIPYIIETASGLNRNTLVALCDAYEEEVVDEAKGDTRIVLKLHPDLAPYKVAVFPLFKKDGLAEKAREIFKKLQKEFYSYYDEGGAIGKRYRRQDEIGTPFCVTIDYDTLEKQVVTIRLRDSMKQISVNENNIVEVIREEIKNYKK